MRIVHLTNTTLADAPGMLSDAINHFTDHHSVCFQFNDKAPSRSLFQPSCFYISADHGDLDILKRHLQEADVVHIHNMVPVFALAQIAESARPDRKYIYQVHSPTMEPPLFADMSEELGIEFDERLVIGHFHPRQFPKFTIVPNCLFRSRMFDPQGGRVANRPIRPVVLFTPSTHQRMRFTCKRDAHLDRAAAVLKNHPKLEFHELTNVPPEMIKMSL